MYNGNLGEIDFGSSWCEVRVSEGSSYRESTVIEKRFCVSSLTVYFMVTPVRANVWPFQLWVLFKLVCFSFKGNLHFNKKITLNHRT